MPVCNDLWPQEAYKTAGCLDRADSEQLAECLANTLSFCPTRLIREMWCYPTLIYLVCRRIMHAALFLIVKTTHELSALLLIVQS